MIRPNARQQLLASCFSCLEVIADAAAAEGDTPGTAESLQHLPAALSPPPHPPHPTPPHPTPHLPATTTTYKNSHMLVCLLPDHVISMLCVAQITGFGGT
jgi:hypothetical protein